MNLAVEGGKARPRSVSGRARGPFVDDATRKTRVDQEVLAFCHIPKAAGTSVRQVLRSWYGPRHYDVPQARGRFNFVGSDDVDWILRRWPGVCSLASHNLSPCRELSTTGRTVHWFTFLRDPIKRYVSYYQFYVNRWWGHEKVPFDDWLERSHHHNNQVKMIAGEEDLDEAVRLLEERVAVVGLQEHYDESMQMLGCFTGNPYIPDVIRRGKNKASSRHIEDKIYSQLERYESRLIKANELDLELYRHVRESIYPSMRERFLTDRDAAPAGLARERVRMRLNYISSFVVRNGLQKPLRKKVFRLVGYGNREL
jgi:hypothetical protein